MARTNKDKESYCLGLGIKKEEPKIPSKYKETYLYSESGNLIGSIYIENPIPEKFELNGWIYNRQEKVNLIKEEKK